VLFASLQEDVRLQDKASGPFGTAWRLHYQQPGFTACFMRHTGDGSAPPGVVICDCEDA
jgi:hypothetical protein